MVQLQNDWTQQSLDKIFFFDQNVQFKVRIYRSYVLTQLAVSTAGLTCNGVKNSGLSLRTCYWCCEFTYRSSTQITHWEFYTKLIRLIFNLKVAHNNKHSEILYSQLLVTKTN